jgi:Mg2+ and Co2+ transporter CorA
MPVELLHVHQQTISCYLEKTLPSEGYLWLVADRSENIDLNSLINQYTGKTLNERHIEDLKQPNHPSFYEGMTDYDLIIFRCASDLKESAKRVFPVTVFIVFDKLLISLCDKRDDNLEKIRQLFADQKRTVPGTPETLAEFCLGFLVDRYLDVKQGFDTRLSAWQKKLLQVKSVKVDWDALLAFKTDVRRIKTLCEEQVDILNSWRTYMRLNTHHVDARLQQQLVINLNDVVDHANRAVKLATQLQQEVESLMQLHFTILSHRTNEIMRVLAVVTCIFLPPNLITGIFGMNFTSIPDLSKPHAFYFAVFFMLIFSALLWVVFRWRRWV